MPKKFMQIVKEIAGQFAISFFISCFVVVAVYFLFAKKVDTYLALVDMVTVVEKEDDEQEIQFDSIKKRLAHYPDYGEIWATIKIPDINVEAPIAHGDDLDIIKNSVGHFVASYFPGEGGSVLLAAHNSRQHFMYIPQLKIGAEIIIEANYGTFTYKVTSTKIVNYQDTENFPIQSEKELLMLYTCYPVNTVGFKSQRYVVYAELVGAKYDSEV